MTTPAKPPEMQDGRKGGSSHIPSPHPEPEQSPAGGELPDGWVLVRRYPTGAMQMAGGAVAGQGCDLAHETWAQMIRACPPPPALARQAPAPSGEPLTSSIERDNDLLRRADVLAMLHRLADKHADLALYGEETKARQREAMEAAFTHARCAVALMPAAPAPSGRDPCEAFVAGWEACDRKWEGPSAAGYPTDVDAAWELFELGKPALSGGDEREAVGSHAFEALWWALDLLDLYDERLIEIGEPADRVLSPEHQDAKRKAFRALTVLGDALSRQAASAAGGGE